MAYSHIAHDCVLGNDIVLTNQAALAGSVHVGDGAILGGYAIVHQFCSIGSYSFCAMGSAVNKDIPAYVKVRGNPAKPFGINVTGIKRIGYSKETIEALRSAYRSIYRKKLTVDEAVKDLDSLRKDFKEVDIFLSSIEELIDFKDFIRGAPNSSPDLSPATIAIFKGVFSRVFPINEICLS